MGNRDIGGIKSPLDSMAKDLYLEDEVEGHGDQQSPGGGYV